MPIYEYHCQACESDFEKLVLSSADKSIECPECRGKKVTKLMSAANSRPNGIPTGSGGFDSPGCSPSGGG